MELKDYQKKTLEQVKRYLEALAELKAKNEKAVQIDPEMSFDFPQRAWAKVVGTAYYPKKNGLGGEFAEKKIEFQVIFGDEWEAKINKIFGI